MSLQSILAPVPGTQRGQSVLLGSHDASESLVYCCGRAVFLRSLSDPRRCDVYAQHAANATVARVSPDGAWVASGDAGGNVRVWARATAEHRLKLERRAMLSGPITDIAWSPDGARVAAAADARGGINIASFALETGAPSGAFDGCPKRCNTLAFRPTRGEHRLVTGSDDYAINTYASPGPAPLRLLNSSRNHSNFVLCARFSADGRTFVATGADGQAILYDGETSGPYAGLFDTGSPSAPQAAHYGSCYAAAWAPAVGDGRLLTAGADRMLKLWDAATQTVVCRFEARSGGAGGGSSGALGRAPSTRQSIYAPGAAADVDEMQVGCAWVGPGGCHVVSLSLAGTLRLWDPRTPGGPVQTIDGHGKPLTALTVGRPGELFSASFDGVICRWAAGAAVRLRGLGHTNAVVGLAGHAKLNALFSAGLDDHFRRTPLTADAYDRGYCVRLGGCPAAFDVPGEGALAVAATTQGAIVLVAADGVVLSSTRAQCDPTAVALSPDGAQVIVGGSDGKLRLFSVQDGGKVLEPLGAPLAAHRSAVTAARISPDGRLLATADSEGEACVWDAGAGGALPWVCRSDRAPAHNGARVNCLSWAPNSERFATGGLDNGVVVHDARRGRGFADRKTIRDAHGGGGVTALAWDSTTCVASAGADACVRTWAV